MVYESDVWQITRTRMKWCSLFPIVSPSFVLLKQSSAKFSTVAIPISPWKLQQHVKMHLTVGDKPCCRTGTYASYFHPVSKIVMRRVMPWTFFWIRIECVVNHILIKCCKKIFSSFSISKINIPSARHVLIARFGKIERKQQWAPEKLQSEFIFSVPCLINHKFSRFEYPRDS